MAERAESIRGRRGLDSCRSCAGVGPAIKSSMVARLHGLGSGRLPEGRLMEIVLIVMVVAAALTDLHTRRIPNWIPVSGAAIGVIFGGLPSLAGAALGFGIFIIL